MYEKVTPHLITTAPRMPRVVVFAAIVMIVLGGMGAANAIAMPKPYVNPYVCVFYLMQMIIGIGLLARAPYTRGLSIFYLILMAIPTGNAIYRALDTTESISLSLGPYALTSTSAVIVIVALVIVLLLEIGSIAALLERPVAHWFDSPTTTHPKFLRNP